MTRIKSVWFSWRNRKSLPDYWWFYELLGFGETRDLPKSKASIGSTSSGQPSCHKRFSCHSLPRNTTATGHASPS
jgi:hypothetical protein